MRKAVVILGAAIVAAGLIGALALSTRPASSSVTQAQAVQPQVKDLFDKVTAPASIVAFREIEVRSRVGGLAMTLLVRPGDEVQSGQILARIEGDAVQADILHAENELTQARAAAAKLRHDASLGSELAQVRLKAAELSIQQAEAGLASAKETLKEQLPAAQSRLAQARTSVETLRTRVASGDALDTELEAALQQLAAAQAELAALDLERSPQVKEASLRVDAAHQSLEQARLDIDAAEVLPEQLTAADSAVAVAEGVLATLHRNQADLEVKAPVAGKVLEVPVRDGQIAQPGTLVAVIGQTDKQLARARVDELDIAKVQVGQSVVMRSTAFPADSFKGKVTRIAPQSAGSSPGTTAVYEVDMEFDDPEGKFRLGMSVDTEIAAPPHTGALTVPAEALREENGERFVWVIETGMARRCQVVAGLVAGGDMEILKGLEKDAKVIVGPADLLTSLKDGQLVAVGSPEG